MNDQNLTLLNNAIFKEIMYFNIHTLEMQIFEREEKVKCDGIYDYIKRRRFLFFSKSEMMMFYRRGDHLYIKVKEQEVCLNDDIQISYKRRFTMIIFKIYRAGKKVYSVMYRSFRFDRLNLIDPDFTEDREEDQDLCLFIYNVCNDPRKMKLLYRDAHL
ncbi:hypothetical protein IC619_013945 [Hazenella sp. IB182353]|uniref:hypothetical protein n=1 Tax=Polycladospora coralii TaxID=2771432 RepID=UPI001747C59B|nr:hypothetical protein [Polycladospora coralii]MBS7531585.1 hypothetical protein [Polycladospora coralii]